LSSEVGSPDARDSGSNGETGGKSAPGTAGSAPAPAFPEPGKGAAFPAPLGAQQASQSESARSGSPSEPVAAPSAPEPRESAAPAALGGAAPVAAGDVARDVGDRSSGVSDSANADPARGATVLEAPAPSNVSADTKAAPRRPRGLGRIKEWFWQGWALRDLREKGPLATPFARELRRRAALAAELGDTMLEPRAPFRAGAPDAVACELYRESIFWGLAAHAALEASATQGPALENLPSASTVAQLSRGGLPELLASADPALLARAAGGEAEARALGEWIGPRTFVEFADLEASEQARLARSLKVFAHGLIDHVDPLGPEVDRLWSRRMLRTGLLTAVLIAAAIATPRAIDAWRWKIDLARGAAWTASSRYPEYGCTSPAQDCEGKGPYFFGTQEEDKPWIVFDLGRVTQVSRFEIQNREDFTDRAVPLVVSVSTDQKNWKDLVRRKDEFDTFRMSFPPVQARWVKLWVDKRTHFHLQRVRIGP
jgi:hypothetical protein